jgi:hypothetical protein
VVGKTTWKKTWWKTFKLRKRISEHIERRWKRMEAERYPKTV